jgi:hypothetical protein
MSRPTKTNKRRRRRPVVQAATPSAWFSIASFCKAHGISQALYFKAKNEGWGPQESAVGVRRMISIEAAAKWRAEREAAAARERPQTSGELSHV